MPRNPDKKPCSVLGCSAWATPGLNPSRHDFPGNPWVKIMNQALGALYKERSYDPV